MRAKNMALAGWGRTFHASSTVYRPENRGQLRQLVSLPPRMIARGAGRSYGDQALCGQGATVLCQRLDRFISFDPRTGILEAEAGVDFATLYKIFTPRGFVAPVTPGTAKVTLGGAAANDVHGKNHERDGTFGRHVQWIDLILADGSERRVSRDCDPELFHATLGGGGLTGLIASLALRLIPIATAAVKVTNLPMANLDHMLDAFSEQAGHHLFSVGWIDGTAKGGNLGRGILELADWSETPCRAVPPKSRRIPLDAPNFVLNKASIALFNKVYRVAKSQAGTKTVPAWQFFYPLDALDDWNRLYGRRGFVQFQCVVPETEARVALHELLKAAGTPFLVVLKRLGAAGDGLLSFPMPGYTLALDYPWSAETAETMRRLTHLTRQYGGRIYLAKDACATAEDLAAMYPQLDRFRQVLDRVDPARRFGSCQSHRLGISGDAT